MPIHQDLKINQSQYFESKVAAKCRRRTSGKREEVCQMVVLWWHMWPPSSAEVPANGYPPIYRRVASTSSRPGLPKHRPLRRLKHPTSMPHLKSFYFFLRQNRSSSRPSLRPVRPFPRAKNYLPSLFSKSRSGSAPEDIAPIQSGDIEPESATFES